MASATTDESRASDELFLADTLPDELIVPQSVPGTGLAAVARTLEPFAPVPQLEVALVAGLASVASRAFCSACKG